MATCWRLFLLYIMTGGALDGPVSPFLVSPGGVRILHYLYLIYSVHAEVTDIRPNPTLVFTI